MFYTSLKGLISSVVSNDGGSTWEDGDIGDFNFTMAIPGGFAAFCSTSDGAIRVYAPLQPTAKTNVIYKTSVSPTVWAALPI